ncbi:acyl-CoA dehydrogenase family protein [Jatrophihabitans fulvus]
MNFDLSPEQYLLERTVTSFLLKNHPVGPTLVAAEAEARAAVAREPGAAGSTATTPAWDGDVWRELAQLGVGALGVPEEHGGLALGVLDLAVAAQALGYGAAPGPWLGHWLATAALAGCGSPDQRDRWLPGLADGTLRASLVWDDPGTPVLGARSADVLVVRAGPSLSLVTSDSFEVRPLPGLDYTRPLDAVTIKGNAEPLPGADAASVARLRATGLVLVAADAFGGARRVLDETVAYVKVRRQFGRTIGQFQAVKHQVADLALLVEPCRGLWWYAAHALDESLPDALDAAALAKSHVADAYVQAARDAIELHGGIGYTWECDLHVYLRRALLDRQYLGEPESLRSELADAAFGPVRAGRP